MISVYRTLDVGLLYEIGSDPKVWDETTEDGATVNNLETDVINTIVLAIWSEEDQKNIGLVKLKPLNKSAFEAHIKILPQFRGEKALNAGHKVWEWIVKHLKGSTIYSLVPTCCGNVEKFLEKFKFEKYGIIPKAFEKRGDRHDMTIYSREAI